MMQLLLTLQELNQAQTKPHALQATIYNKISKHSRIKVLFKLMVLWQSIVVAIIKVNLIIHSVITKETNTDNALSLVRNKIKQMQLNQFSSVNYLLNVINLHKMEAYGFIQLVLIYNVLLTLSDQSKTIIKHGGVNINTLKIIVLYRMEPHMQLIQHSARSVKLTTRNSRLSKQEV